jgi:hypothetical protein
MNSTENPQNDDAMGKVLRQWNVDSPLPPGFQEQVWQRIAKAGTGTEPAAWAGLWRLIEVVLQRPRFAYAYLAILLVAGVAAGSWAAQIKSTRLDSELSLRYVQSVDPFRADDSQP